jgi:hypothetical protein
MYAEGTTIDLQPTTQKYGINKKTQTRENQNKKQT